ncbi:hypothetical protein MMC11_007272 [Xylographa trunciseda]|nr:hypothetical protein [Xylographa trunciseda]
MSTSSTTSPTQPSPAPSPPESPERIYTTLTTHLHTHRLSTLELEILPSSSPSPLLHDGLSLAISKPALIHAFITARATLLSAPPLTPPTPSHPSLSQDIDSATKILLLYDPEHLSAATWRKRHISHLAQLGRSDQEQNITDREENACGQSTPPDQELRHAVGAEMAFLRSLLTSPLPRHAKSPTLWWHRCWLVTNHLAAILPRDDGPAMAAQPSLPARTARPAFLASEVDVLLQAAERHKANYHAFHYGRRLLSLHPGALSCGEGGGVVEKVRKWCFGHPRDVSGWGFLAFLLGRDGLVASGWERKGMIGMASLRTREFVADLGWKGDAVEWFLREMDDAAKQADVSLTEGTVGGIG